MPVRHSGRPSMPVLLPPVPLTGASHCGSLASNLSPRASGSCRREAHQQMALSMNWQSASVAAPPGPAPLGFNATTAALLLVEAYLSGYRPDSPAL
ncbi:hypothetical protein QQF64_021862 [Cirrhinus molitorella]|uniref:Uncharacterized protein n=1 Tax=Cirrhinus molitorella TaxID=172907 RepID=A0ABR3LA21_9TELE